MNKWIKAVVYLIVGFVLSKIVNNIGYELFVRNSKGLSGAYIAALFGGLTYAYFIFKALVEVGFIKLRSLNEKSITKIEIIKNNASDDDSFLYLNAINELRENRNEGLWAKCFAENNGDNPKAEAAYIRSHVQLSKNAESSSEKKDVKDNDEYKYSSAEHLYKTKNYIEKKYNKSTYFLLSNSNVAIKIGKFIYVYISENDLQRAIDSKNFKSGYKVIFEENIDS
jgi:hypothetical protein